MKIVKHIIFAFVAATCLALAVSAQKPRPQDPPKKPPPPKIEPKPKDPPKDGTKPKKPEDGYFVVISKESNYAE